MYDDRAQDCLGCSRQKSDKRLSAIGCPATGESTRLVPLAAIVATGRRVAPGYTPRPSRACQQLVFIDFASQRGLGAAKPFRRESDLGGLGSLQLRKGRRNRRRQPRDEKETQRKCCFSVQECSPGTDQRWRQTGTTPDRSQVRVRVQPNELSTSPFPKGEVDDCSSWPIGTVAGTIHRLDAIAMGMRRMSGFMTLPLTAMTASIVYRPAGSRPPRSIRNVASWPSGATPASTTRSLSSIAT